MKNLFSALTTLALTTISFAAFANGPGEMLDSTAQRIRTGVEACGLTYMSGQDPSLDYQIRARNVDFVIVTTRNGYTNPGVLVDHSGNGYGYNNGVQLTYSRTNGGLIMNISRDYDFNDLAIDTAYQGRVAFSNTYFYGQNLQTRYYVRSPRGGQLETNLDSFTQFVNTQVADDFVARVCHDGNTSNFQQK